MRRQHLNRLKVLRAENRVTQMDLAAKLGMGRDRYWRIENGYEKPTAEEVARLAKALRVDTTDLGLAATA